MSNHAIDRPDPRPRAVDDLLPADNPYPTGSLQYAYRAFPIVPGPLSNLWVALLECGGTAAELAPLLSVYGLVPSDDFDRALQHDRERR